MIVDALQTVEHNPAPASPVRAEAYAGLRRTIQQWETGYDNLDVLEAGGGSLSYVAFDTPARITAVDISAEQLARNAYADVKILGDLHKVDLGTEKYDAAVIWEVLEHVQGPRIILDKLAHALKAGGIIIVAVPNPTSLQGLITKWTPHWFHVFVFRYIFGWKDAGKPGHAPFETVHHCDIEPARLADWAHRNNLEVLFRSEYQGARREHLKQRAPLVARCWEAALVLGNLMTGRRLEASDVLFLLRKPGTP